jgi:hypothetical protein
MASAVAPPSTVESEQSGSTGYAARKDRNETHHEMHSNDSPCLSVDLSCHSVERYFASRCADHRTVGGKGDDRPARPCSSQISPMTS